MTNDTFKHRGIFGILKTLTGTDEEMLTKLLSFKRKTTRQDDIKNTVYDNNDRHPDLDKPLNQYNLVKAGRLYFKYVERSWIANLTSIDGLELMWELDAIKVLTPVMVQYRTTLGDMIGYPQLYVIMHRDPTGHEIEEAFLRIAASRGTNKEELLNQRRKLRM